MSDSNSTPTAVAPPPIAVDVGVIAALEIEIGGFLKQLREVRSYRTGTRFKIIEGECAGKVVAVIVSGTGRRAARRATEILWSGHKPRWLISAGFAGGLHPEIVKDEVILANEIVDESGARHRLETLVSSDQKVAVRSGRLLTVDRAAATVLEKSALRIKHSADLVDMESSAVAAFCAERGVRFLSVRVITDTAADELPPWIHRLTARPSSAYRAGAALRVLWETPASANDFLKLRNLARDSSRLLGTVLPKIIQGLA